MSTEIIRERPLVSGLSVGSITNWLKRARDKVLSRKKHLIMGLVGLVVVAVAAFYFWGGQASAAQYLTTKVERGNLQQAQASLQQARAAVTNSRAGVSDAQAKGQAAASTAQNNQAGVAGARANLAVLKAQQDDALSYLKQ